MIPKGNTFTRKVGSSALIVALLAVGGTVLAGCAEDSEPAEPVDTSAFAELVDRAPPRLAALYERGDELIDIGPEGYEETIEDLAGFPIVVNLWASWCGPCRAEFPHLREVSLAVGDRVAFLGLDTDDNDDAARTFLRDNPLPYPSLTDPDKRIANSLGATFGLPATVFYDRTGEKTFVKHGGYTSNEDLIADIRRHAL